MDGDLVTGDAMRVDRDRYVAFAFAGADILLELDVDGIVQFSAGAVSLLDAKANDLAGQPLMDLIADQDQSFAEQFFGATEMDGRSMMKLLSLRSSSGEAVPFIVSCCRLKDLGGHYFVSLTRATASAAGGLARSSMRDPRCCRG